MTDVSELQRIMRQLRDPADGCPWDREQTFLSIVPHTLEEAYEVAETIETGQFDELPAELGDLLFQVIFYCQLAEEEGRFGFADVVTAICEKLTQRHPHVFAPASASALDTSEVAAIWEQRKAEERMAKNAPSEMDQIANALPALSRAAKVQKRAARVGFDWPEIKGAWDKIAEELDELREAIEQRENRLRLEDEFGDVLFSAVNVGRHLGLEPESCLRRATAKFERRFRRLEADMAAQGSDLAKASLEQLDAAWAAAKKAEKKTGA